MPEGFGNADGTPTSWSIPQEVTVGNPGGLAGFGQAEEGLGPVHSWVTESVKAWRWEWAQGAGNGGRRGCTGGWPVLDTGWRPPKDSS